MIEICCITQPAILLLLLVQIRGGFLCQMPLAAVDGRSVPDSLDEHKRYLSRESVLVGHGELLLITDLCWFKQFDLLFWCINTGLFG